MEPLELGLKATEAALGKKAIDPVILDVRGLVSYCDFFLIFSGANRRQVHAIAEAILETLERDHGVEPIGIEGMQFCRWVLVDYGSVVVHIFDDELRSFYDLEGLWTDAPRVPIPGVTDLADVARLA